MKPIFNKLKQVNRISLIVAFSLLVINVLFFVQNKNIGSPSVAPIDSPEYIDDTRGTFLVDPAVSINWEGHIVSYIDSDKLILFLSPKLWKDFKGINDFLVELPKGDLSSNYAGIVNVEGEWYANNCGLSKINPSIPKGECVPQIRGHRIIKKGNIDAQLVANRLFRENCNRGPGENPLHRLEDEMSFCIAELKKIDSRNNYSDIDPQIKFSTIMGGYQIKIQDSQFLKNGITVSVLKDGKVVSVDDDYYSFKENREYPDYVYELWEARTGLKDRMIEKDRDKVFAIVSSRGGTWRGSEQLKIIYLDYNTGELIITPAIIFSDDLVFTSPTDESEDYKNALAKEIGNLMRLQLKSIK